ncbi:MAG: hypothetical protein M3417_10280 [Actinomycetota bacterium]|nr:hypothetical protein [Actinomycetota bacterium]
MKHWVYTIGQRDQAPPLDWMGKWGHHVHEMWFSRTKTGLGTVHRGDLALIYGSKGTGFLAAVRVTDDAPTPNPHPTGSVRYPWRMAHDLLVAKAADGFKAVPEDAGISTQRIMRGPYSGIEPEEFARGLDLLLLRARESAW